MDIGTVPLADAIRMLRRELLSAMEEGVGEALQFKLGPVELELQVQLSREGVGKGGVNVWAVSFAAEGKLGSGMAHKLKLTLHPIGPLGDVRVSDTKDYDPTKDRP
jgi:hypothetical protein